MKAQYRISTLLSASLFVAACTNNPLPPPVEERDTPAPIDRSPPEDVVAPPSSTNAATSALLAQVEATDDDRTAIALIERAIRLDPRNADLWTKSGHLHIAQGEHRIAEQHIRKAIALAGSNDTQTRDAWLALADLREAQGRESEAANIRRRYRASG